MGLKLSYFTSVVLMCTLHMHCVRLTNLSSWTLSSVGLSLISTLMAILHRAVVGRVATVLIADDQRFWCCMRSASPIKSRFGRLTIIKRIKASWNNKQWMICVVSNVSNIDHHLKTYRVNLLRLPAMTCHSCYCSCAVVCPSHCHIVRMRLRIVMLLTIRSYCCCCCCFLSHSLWCPTKRASSSYHTKAWLRHWPCYHFANRLGRPYLPSIHID